MPRPVPRELIRPGFRLPGALLDASGRVLVRGGVELDSELVQALQERQDIELFADCDWLDGASDWRDPSLGDDLDADSDNGETIHVESLRAGMRLAQDIYDEADVLLLAAGMTVSPRFLELLEQRRIKFVKLRPAPVEPGGSESLNELVVHADVETPSSRRVEEALRWELQSPPRLSPVRAWRRPRLPDAALKLEASRGLEHHEVVSGVVAEVGETLQLGGKVNFGSLRSSIGDFLNMVTLDFDLLPLIVSMQRTRDEYLFDHCVNVALLSMTVGAQLGLSHDELMKVGLGALLHDVGMLRVPGTLRLAPRILTEAELREIRRHPFHTVELLEGVRGLPPTVRSIAFQVHERCDGGGYPRGVGTKGLHPYSLIVAVADAYVAMTRPRPHRPAMMPYDAARSVLIDASRNRFDRTVVRAFLDAVALLPIGSIVELSTGKMGRVIRANPDKHTCPVVEELDEKSRPTDLTIDLSRKTDVKIVRAYPGSLDSAGVDRDREGRDSRPPISGNVPNTFAARDLSR